TNVVINSSDFVDAVGSYTITYNAIDIFGNVATEVIRTVNVVDIAAPVISLLGDNPQTIELGTGYTELGATTNDGSTVIIDSSDFVDELGSYTIRYNATDASGNMAIEVARIVNVVDTTAPVIVLLGANPQELVKGSTYVELGATTDDGSYLVIDASSIDVNTQGSYSVTYNAVDDSGNVAMEVIRTVNVTPLLSVETHVFNTVSLYPNPVSDEFVISGLKEEIIVDIFDLQGKHVKRVEGYVFENIDISNMESGIYLIRLIKGKTVKNLRLLKR
ncbi:DUF5011 domain-containing protein, partial [Aquimarina sp. MMG015]|uniref:immunoglobulin-like domain-containing protein n=1 Tax=Aquimarina sp. MMG015 TaxID=2822689 RepID=UPI001B39DD78